VRKMVGKEIEEVEKELEEQYKYILPSVEYKKALKEGKLLGLKCEDCKQITCPPMAVCQRCGSKNMKVVELSGKGELMTFTVISVPPASFEGPYICCLVKTMEGPWIPGRLDYDIEKAQKEGLALVGRKVKFEKAMVLQPDEFNVSERVFPLFKFVEE